MAFFSILLRPPSGFLRSLSLALRVDFWPVIPLTALVIYLLFYVPGRIGQIITASAVLFLFAMPLAGMWAYGHTQTSVISGLIQLNDASGYYVDALRLTSGTNFSSFSSRRPLFAGFLSVLLALTGHNLMISLAILSGVTAIACYLLAREIQKTHGVETAVFLLMMMFLYYRLHSGISMTENFGIALGALGFAVLWRGAEEKNLTWIWIGLFSTTIALNARAGAFFVLPFLIVWTGWLFRTEDKWISWRSVLLASTAIVAGFGANLILGRMIGSPGGIPFSNFSYTIYSIAAGGKSWTYIAEVHPEVLLMAEPERTQRMFQLGFDLIREKPIQTIQGALFFWGSIFTDTLYNVFAFVAKENWVINPWVKWGLYLLSGIGIFAWLRDKKSPFNSLIIACIIGIYLSVPLAPPTDSFRMRPYAASMAMINILPALGFGYITSMMKKNVLKQPIPHQIQPSNFMLSFNTLILVVTFIGPVLTKFMSSKPDLDPRACSSGTDRILINFATGTHISTRKNKDVFLDWAPDYHLYLFQKNTHSIENESLINWLETIPVSQSLLVSLDFLTNKGLLISVPSELLPKEPGYIQICGYFENDPSLKGYPIFYGSEIFPAVPEQ